MSNWSTKINVRRASANPIIQLINFIVGLIEIITGSIRSGSMSEEEKHVVITIKQKRFWIFTSSESALKISKSRISGIKVSTVRRWIFFSSNECTIYASGVSDQVSYAVKCSYKEISDKAVSWTN